MFVPLIFTLDSIGDTGNYWHWAQFYMYADACIRNGWPIIAHERYFDRFSRVEDTMFGLQMRDVMSTYYMSNLLTTENMLALKTYPVPQTEEDKLVADYASQFDCWVDLLKNENSQFEQIIGDLLDKIIADYGEKPEGVLYYECLPKALKKAANKRGIPVFSQGGGVVRPPFASAMNGFNLVNDFSPELVKSKYDRFLSKNTGVPMLSRKGLLRLFASEQCMKDIHCIDNEPEYDVGVILCSVKAALQYMGPDGYLSDNEMSERAKGKYDKVLIRSRPGYERPADALDDSLTCFLFCCKCKRVLGLRTTGIFDAMLAGCITHEYGVYIFNSFCNRGIEDDSKGVAPIEFLNFILFGICTPFTWLTDPDYLRFLLSGTSEKDLYMRSFEYYTRGISRDDLEFYYMSDDRAYRPGDPLYFTSGHKPHEYAAYYCTGGLHRNDGICTWSNGTETSFEFDLHEPVSEPLTISVALYEVMADWSSQNPSQTVTCEVNGAGCGSVTLVPERRYMSFTVPSECFTDKLRVTFRYSYLRPDEGLTPAVAFAEMRISRLGQMPMERAMSSEIARLGAHIAGLNEQIDSIYNSRSWKLGSKIVTTAEKIAPGKNK